MTAAYIGPRTRPPSWGRVPRASAAISTLALLSLIGAVRPATAAPDALSEAAALARDGRDPKALASLDAERAKADVAKDPARLAVIDRARGDALRALGRFAESRTALEAAGDEPAPLRSLGATLLATGSSREAVDAFDRLIVVAARTGNAALGADAHRLLGTALDALGRPGRALAEFDRATVLATEAGRPAIAARALAAAARVSALVGDSAGALDRAERALEVLPEDASGDDESAVVGTLLRLRVELGDLDGARGLRPRLESALGRGVSPRERLAERLDLARLLLRDDQPEEALAAADAALPDAKASEAPRVVAQALLLRGEALRRIGRAKEAVTALDSAAELASKAGDRPLLVAVLVEQGTAKSSLGDASGAAVLDRAVREAERAYDRRGLVLALTARARAHLARGEDALALAGAERSASEAEPLVAGLGEAKGPLARGEVAEISAVGVAAAFRLKNAPALFAMLERGRAGSLLEALGGWRALAWKMIPVPLREAEAVAGGKEARARAEYAVAADVGALAPMRVAQATLDASRGEVVGVVDRIRREAKRDAGFCYPRPDPIEDAQARLAAEDALVLYGAAGDRLVALVVRHEAARIVDLGSAETIGEYLTYDWSDGASDAAPSRVGLRRALVEPLGLDDGVTRVLVSPEGALARVPFAALMGERRVVYIPSATVAGLLCAGADSGEATLGFGDPLLVRPGAGAGAVASAARGGRRSSLPALPGARKEVKAAADEAKFGADASETAFRDLAAGEGARRWRSVLFGCHGLVDARHPSYSMLVLAPDANNDGDLTAVEIAQLRIRADLAFLSACETAVGPTAPAEGPMTLARAFLVAGTPRVIGSLWRVDDAATSALVSAFYEAFRKGDAADVALSKAQGRVRAEPKWAHPRYWAAWQLWGAP